MRLVSRLTAVFLLCAPLALAAQGSRVQVGVEGGINFARWSGDDAGGSETRTAFAAGAFFRIPLTASFALEPAFYYSMQGTTVDLGSGVSGAFKLDYFQVPLRLRFSAPLGPNPAIRPYLYVAPALGVRDRCRIQAKAQGQSLEVDCDDEDALGVRFDTKTFEAGLHFGAGVEYQRISLGLRYQLGLTSIDDTGSDADVKNRVLAIVAGYRFGGAR